MKTIHLSIQCVLLVICALNPFTQIKCQVFQTNYGIDSLEELSQGAIVLSNPNAGYMSVSSFYSNPSKKIKLTGIAPLGQFASSFLYSITNANLEAGGIEKSVKRPRNTRDTINIIGSTYSLGRIILGRPKNGVFFQVDESGKVLKAFKHKENLSWEFGKCTTVESVDNGVLVAGNTSKNAAGPSLRLRSNFFVSFFSKSATGLMPNWSFQYFDERNLDRQFYCNKSCIGTFQSSPAIFVTGYYTDSTSSKKRYPFVSCIDIKTGNEFWRASISLPNFSIAEGVDLIQDKGSKQILLIGYGQQERVPKKTLFTMFLNPNGKIIISAIYKRNMDLVGRDISYSLKDNFVVVAGYGQFLVQKENKYMNTAFMIEMSSNVIDVAGPIIYYESSRANPNATESIHINNVRPASSGYIISTQSFPNGITKYNDFLIGTDPKGKSYFADCPSTPENKITAVTPSTNLANFPAKTPTKWFPIEVKVEQHQDKVKICNQQ